MCVDLVLITPIAPSLHSYIASHIITLPNCFRSTFIRLAIWQVTIYHFDKMFCSASTVNKCLRTPVIFIFFWEGAGKTCAQGTRDLKEIFFFTLTQLI